MRRFSLMVFVLAVLAAIAGTRKETADPESADHLASANVKGGDPARGVAANDAPVAGKTSAATHGDAGDHLLKTVAIIALPKEATEQPGAVITTSAPAAAVEVSLKPAVVDPALEDMDRDDLNAAAQAELLRLGCYDAKIDGRWGRKSEAAVEAFGERIGADWSDRPRTELVTALRTLPAGHCSAECTVKTSAGQCAAASVPPAETTADQSYLPPWMQGTKPSNIETPAIAAPGADKTLSDAGPASPKAKRNKNVRRREFRRERLAQGYERRRGSKSWLPKGWPGSRD